MRFIVIIIILLIVISGIAYSAEVIQEADKQLVSRLKDALSKDDHIKEWPANLPPLEKIVSDASDYRRGVSYTLIHSAIINSDSHAKRTVLCKILCRGLVDEDQATVRHTVLALTNLKVEDFDNESKALVEDRLMKSFKPNEIGLAGIFGPEGKFAGEIREVANRSKDLNGGVSEQNLIFYARMALSRWGDEAAFKSLTEEIGRLSPGQRLLIFQPRLEYVLNGIGVKFFGRMALSETLVSDPEILGPVGSKAPVLEANFAISSLSRMVQGFPLQVDKDTVARIYLSDKLSLCQTWLRSQRNLTLNDGKVIDNPFFDN